MECAVLGTRRLMALARETARPAHILHVSTAEELGYPAGLPRRRARRGAGEPPHPDRGPYDRLGGYAVMNPPIRDARHMARPGPRSATARWMWSAPTTRRIPAPPRNAPGRKRGGLTGVQTIVPVMLDHVSAGTAVTARLVDLMCAGPARVYGVPARAGWRPATMPISPWWTCGSAAGIEESWIVSPCGWTPFAGQRCTGWPMMTIIRGQVAMREDEVLGAPLGRPSASRRLRR